MSPVQVVSPMSPVSPGSPNGHTVDRCPIVNENWHDYWLILQIYKVYSILVHWNAFNCNCKIWNPTSVDESKEYPVQLVSPFPISVFASGWRGRWLTNNYNILSLLIFSSHWQGWSRKCFQHWQLLPNETGKGACEHDHINVVFNCLLFWLF